VTDNQRVLLSQFEYAIAEGDRGPAEFDYANLDFYLIPEAQGMAEIRLKMNCRETIR
jgi:hypothetical protein